MAKKLRIGVIFGGRSGEHEVALRSAQSVIEAMDRGKYEVVPIAITKEGNWLASAAAANMVGHGQMRAGLAGAGVVLASVASALVNLPIIYRNTKNPTLSRRLALVTVVLSVLGIGFLVFQQLYWPSSN